QQADMLICGEAENAVQALRNISASNPDVIVVDLSLESSSGLDLIKDLKTRLGGVPILVLSMHDEKLYAERALRAGARGYVMKREVTKNIVAAIRGVLAGHLWVSEEISQRLAEKYVDGHPMLNESPVARLSDRELQVFRLLGQGQAPRQ